MRDAAQVAAGGGSPESMFSIPGEAGIDAVLLFTGSGTPVGGWTREPMPHEVLTVMAATLLGSVDTLLETLGQPAPPAVFLKVGGKRLLLQPVDHRRSLLVIAEERVTERAMAHFARGVLSQLPSPASPPRGDR